MGFAQEVGELGDVTENRVDAAMVRMSNPDRPWDKDRSANPRPDQFQAKPGQARSARLGTIPPRLPMPSLLASGDHDLTPLHARRVATRRRKVDVQIFCVWQAEEIFNRLLKVRTINSMNIDAVRVHGSPPAAKRF
jgi:hypothetical protein